MSTLTAPIEFMGRTHHVEYRPAAFRSPEVVALIDRLRASGDDLERLTLHERVLPHVVVAWDLTDTDGVAIPVKESKVAERVPIDLGVAIMQGLIAHAQRHTEVFEPPAATQRRRRRRRKR